MNSPSFRLFIWLLAATLALSSCGEQFEGFEKLDNGVFRKMNRFGEQSPSLKDAENAIVKISYRHAEGIDSSADFDMYIGHLKMQGDTGNALDSTLFHQLQLLKGGDDYSYIVPYKFYQNTFLDAFQGNFFKPEEMTEIRVNVVRTFNATDFSNYLMNASQAGELEETEAIDLLFLNNPSEAELHGRVFLKRLIKSNGDSIKAGRDVLLTYNTYLLNGTRLDSITEMQFNFGRPGQLIPGMTYALSLMKEGERALVYMPSALAFGENGSSTGIVPPRTPIYFDITVKDVVKPEESLAQRKH
jgi:FKBP-type peptidyl-prolyl cis-trans isomerase FkpA